MINNIVKNNNVIGKGSYGKIYYHPNNYPNYIVKKMNKYNKIRNNFLVNNIKELWWYSLINNNDSNISNCNLNNQINNPDYCEFCCIYSNIINNSSSTSSSDTTSTSSSDTGVFIFNNNFNNIPKMISYSVNSEHLYLLLEHKGKSIFNSLCDVFIEKSKDKSIIENNKNNDKKIEKIEKIDMNKHIILLKLIPLIIYTCSKLFIQLHYAFIRHGDISISNILIDNNENDIYKKIYIIDWGSVVFNRLVINKYNQCAIDYTAPELRNEINSNQYNSDVPSVKSDIYSLGLVILNILDPTKSYNDTINNYIKNSYILSEQNKNIITIINEISNKHDYINKHVDQRLFYLLSRMLDNNINTRIDIESLYMDELLKLIRNEDKYFDKYYLKNILRKQLINFDNNNIDTSFKEIIENNIFYINKNLLIEETFNFLRTYKSKIVNHVQNKYLKLIDTQIILIPVIELYQSYLYLSKNLNCYNINNINHFIISYLCTLKWIDLLFNDDISIYHLFEFYSYLYKLLQKSFNESIILDLLNFITSFDLTFFHIYNKLNGNILYYPYYLDYKYEYINYKDIKKSILKTE